MDRNWLDALSSLYGDSRMESNSSPRSIAIQRKCQFWNSREPPNDPTTAGTSRRTCRFLQYAEDLIKGPVFLHRHYVAHRDIKPDNLMYTDTFRLQIIDFDVATQVSHTYTRYWPSLVRAAQRREGGRQGHGSGTSKEAKG
ncbi:hypothetical protein BJV74DRAFT_268017 [Russula compacta]|nr:hypothetical protein BJV74DRAFT_268017 [Russula compacta]